jgi:phosphosulfolactate phosphohydrolase-like enzyme
VSGQQLIEDDQRADVVLAAERDVSEAVPVLVDGAFTAV